MRNKEQQDLELQTMNSKVENYKYRFLVGFFTATSCIASSYGTFYLLNKGVADYEAGLIIAIANIVATHLAPVLGRIADKSKKWSSKSLVVLLTVCQIIISAILYFVDIPSLTSVIYCILILNVFLIMPIINAICFQYKNNNISIDYGVARGFGSLFFALASFTLGHFTNLWGADIIPFASIIINAIILFLAIKILPNEPVFGEKKSITSNMSNSNALKGGAFFKKYPLFFVMLLGIILVMFFHNMTLIYSIHIVENVGCGSQEMGIAIGIAATAEIPILFLYTRINKRFKTTTLLTVAGVSFCIKGILFIIAGSIWIIYIAQLLQITSFGLIAGARVYYTHEVMDKNDEVTGQTFMNWSETVSCILGSVVGGFLMSFSGGILTVLSVGIVICIIGTLIILICTIKSRKQ